MRRPIRARYRRRAGPTSAPEWRELDLGAHGEDGRVGRSLLDRPRVACLAHEARHAARRPARQRSGAVVVGRQLLGELAEPRDGDRAGPTGHGARPGPAPSIGREEATALAQVATSPKRRPTMSHTSSAVLITCTRCETCMTTSALWRFLLSGKARPGCVSIPSEGMAEPTVLGEHGEVTITAA